MDFTLPTYYSLLNSFSQHNYHFQTFRDYLAKPESKVVILRHDVDLRPQYSLRTAQMEFSLGIKGSYYFRIVPESFNREVINEIAELGHEIGYHYEDLTLAKGNMAEGISSFAKNLEKLRELYPVKTICMHGSPRSPYDSKDLWKEHDYRDFGIVGEPYFDIDFNEVLYLTDTGRRWDGDKVSVRDKISGSKNLNNHFPFRSTSEIINACSEGGLPSQIMVTVHPQRWTDKPLPWIKELLWQNIKNLVKYNIIKIGNLKHCSIEEDF